MRSKVFYIIAIVLVFSCGKEKIESNSIMSSSMKYGADLNKSQNVILYKTPKGKKYHKETCRMVDNFSEKLETRVEIAKYSLKPCQICKPPKLGIIQNPYSSQDNSVGTSASVRCKGRTKKSIRCKHKTKIANGYCFQHGEQSK